MSVVNFDLRPDWLRRHELPGYGPGRRGFEVSVGGARYELVVRHLPETSAMAYAEPEEDPVRPSDGDLLMLLAQAFLGSLPQFPPATPDVAAGWDAYRRERLETGSISVAGWESLKPEVREALSIGVCAALGKSNIRNQLSTPSADE